MKRNLPLIIISALPSLGLALFCLLAPPVAHAVGGSGPFFDSGVVVGTVGSNSLPEISGVAVSTQNPDVLWVNNDGNNPAEVYALGTDGTLLRTYALDGVGTNVDWEDIAIGPGPVQGVDYLYIADTGDNSPSRSFVTIFRVPEPDVNVIPNGTLTGVEALHVKYPSTKYDCETLLVDLNGDIVMVTRDRANDEDNNVIDAVSHVFSYPAWQQAPQAVGATPAPFTLIENVSSTLSNTWDIKGGDVSRDGNWVMLRPSEGGVAVDGMLWIRSPGASLSDVFADPFCLVPLAGEPQGEAVSFNADGSGYYTISEGNNQPVYFYAENNNTPPVVDDQPVSTDEDTDLIITLIASDAEGDDLTYAIVSGTSDGTLSVVSGDQVTYSPDLNFNGTDSFTFVANDGTANSAVATVTITVNPVNDAPVALAGSNQSVFENVLVDLDGSGSFDPDGDPLTSYAWTQDSGPTVILSDSGAAQPSFIAPAVSQDTTLVFSLVVSDGTLPSEADTVSVTVSPLSYDAFAFQEPTAVYGVVTGTVNATSSADGQVQTVTEVRSGSKGRKRLEVEYVLQTIAPPASIVSLELNLVHAWTDLDSPGESLKAFVWNGNINVLDWEDISGMLLDTGVFVPSGSPADYVDGNQSIRIQFRDSGEIQREKADTLSIDSLWANIEVGTPDTEPPTAPTGLVLSAGEFEVILDWGDNPETETDLLGYFVYRSEVMAGEYTALNLAPISESAFQDATVNPATTYY
ncbi:MAG: VCBS repeat-containing protein, partial [Verrucomicrobiales bacterium]